MARIHPQTVTRAIVISLVSTTVEEHVSWAARRLRCYADPLSLGGTITIQIVHSF